MMDGAVLHGVGEGAGNPRETSLTMWISMPRGWKIARSITKDGERRCREMKECVEYKFNSTSRATTVAPGLLRLNQHLAAVSATDAALRALEFMFALEIGKSLRALTVGSNLSIASQGRQMFLSGLLKSVLACWRTLFEIRLNRDRLEGVECREFLWGHIER